MRQRLARLFLDIAFVIIWAAWGYVMWSLR